MPENAAMACDEGVPRRNAAKAKGGRVLSYPLTTDLITMTVLFRRRAAGVLREQVAQSLESYLALTALDAQSGSTPGQIASFLGLSTSRTSQVLGKMGDDGLLQVLSGAKGARVLRLTDAGSHMLFRCRAMVLDECKDLLRALAPKDRDAFETGCAATVAMLQGLFYVGQGLDWAYVYMRSISLSERSFTKNAKSHGFSLNEFRVAFALMQAEGTPRPADLEDLLLMPKATLSDILRLLAERGLVEATRLDGRSKAVALTDAGSERAQNAAKHLDEMLMRDVRHAPLPERLQYVRSAEIIVARERRRLNEAE